jgi:hypothetical protein
MGFLATPGTFSSRILLEYLTKKLKGLSDTITCSVIINLLDVKHSEYSCERRAEGFRTPQ